MNLFCPLRSQSWRVVPLIRLALLALRVAQVCILKKSKGVLQPQVNFFKAQANVKARASTWSPSSKFMRLIQSTEKRATTFTCTCTCTCFFSFFKARGNVKHSHFSFPFRKSPRIETAFSTLLWKPPVRSVTHRKRLVVTDSVTAGAINSVCFSLFYRW